MAPPASTRAFVSSGTELLGLLAAEGADATFGLRDGARVVVDQPAALTLVADGRVAAEVEVAGSAEPTIVLRGHAAARLRTAGTSRPRVRAEGFSDVRVKTYGASRPEVEATGHARLLVIASDASAPYVQATDFSQALVAVRDQARPRCHDWPEDWEARVSDVYAGQRLVCFATEAEAVEAARAVYREWLHCGNRYAASLRVAGAVPKTCPNVVDFRWRRGTVHLELPGDGNPRPWLSPDAHDVEALTEARRAACTRYYLDE